MSLSSTGLLIAGSISFTLGLLVILQEKTITGVVSQIIPNVQASLVLGVLLQLIGQGVITFSAVKSASRKFLSSLQAERQITAAGFNQNIQQLQSRIQADRQAIMAGYSQAMVKLDTLISDHKTAISTPMLMQPEKCRFCGTRIDSSNFCPKCGKAN